jgi:hydrogenase large subunit
MVAKRPIIKSLHKLYKDSLLTRVYARVHEAAVLLAEAKVLLQTLRLDELSCTLKGEFSLTESEGAGIVEAARGSLIHKIRIAEGSVAGYQIIVPTQWNLSHGNELERGVATQAMVGSSTVEEATFIFRTFDVCSVCTTQ